MHGTRSHGQRREGPRRPAGGPMYWGWSPDSGQMEMMDLRNYVDALRAGYDQALEEMYERMQSLAGLVGAGPATVEGGRARARRGRDCRGGHDHHDHHDPGCGGCHDEHHGDGCGHHGDRHHGCGSRHDCRCECCIVDADVVVYARCGEVRVVPIEVRNDTRKDREDVTVEVSGFRTGGGAGLPWEARLAPTGPITIKGCTTASLELLVHVACAGARPSPGKDPAPAKRQAATRAEETGAGAGATLLARAAQERDRTGDVDACVVGYVTVTVGGCLVRPIVVAVAALPDACGTYVTSCSCGSCC